MIEIGVSLKEARLEKGLTISDIQRVTKIRSHYLESLEAGRFECLPGEAYERAFIRTYAAALGVDAKPLITRYDNLRQEELRKKQALLNRPEPSTPALVARRIWATLNGTMEWLGL